MLPFQSHTGSIQRFIASSTTVSRSPVSIPHWFDSTRQAAFFTDAESKMFQSHTGSIQRAITEINEGYPKEFQSHTGSIQRRLGQHGIVDNRQVSIPHWFDSTPASRSAWFISLARFNPTLVRFNDGLIIICITI